MQEATILLLVIQSGTTLSEYRQLESNWKA